MTAAAVVSLAGRQLSSAIMNSTRTRRMSPFYPSICPVLSSSRGFRPGGLRLPDSSELSSDSDAETPARDRKSRNEKKRDARRAVQWGMDLSDFSAPQIKRVLRLASLDGEVYDALMLVKRLGSDVREGKRRQFNYIGRLLRDAQPELMNTLIRALKDGDNAKLQSLSGEGDWTTKEDEEYDSEEEVTSKHVEVAERWFEGLVEKDSSITNEIYSIRTVDFDRQELRKLVRNVQLTREQIDGEFDATGYFAATFTFTNNCRYTVWPGSLASAGAAPLSPTGFLLKKGESRQISTPTNWSGRLWGRTNCRQNPASSTFVCTTGDCGTGEVECSGAGASPPATLAEFTLDANGGTDYYDVSLVDGFNLPISVAPQIVGGRRSANCTLAECAADINGACPAELRVADEGAAVACRSACDAFGADEYCCRGAYGGPGTCTPTSYSLFFKRSCPRAYSYAYDDGSSVLTCATAQGYVITFCPLTSRRSDGGEKAKPADLTNYPMVFAGGNPNNVFSDAAALRQPSFIPTLAGVALVSFWHIYSSYR